MPSMVSIASLAGALLAGRHRTRLVINQVDTLTSDVAIEHAHDLRMRSLPLLARLLYRRADALVAATEGVLQLMHANGTVLAHGREAVIPIPVDIEKFESRAREAPEHPWLRHKETPVVVSLGRLVKRKNYPLLLQSFAEVRRQRPVRLVIIGEGPERPVLEREISRLGMPDVSLAGPEANPWASIARADCFVMASDDEAFCLAIVEAMACGVPVVSTDAIGGGPRSILEGGQHGFLGPTGDFRALAGALNSVLGSEAVRQRYAAASRVRCRSYEPVRIATQWCEFLSTVESRQPRWGQAVAKGAAEAWPSVPR
jgi:glycosyltransferase involved in cell wall biosynthesis